MLKRCWKAGKLEGGESIRLGSWKAGKLEGREAIRLGSYKAHFFKRFQASQLPSIPASRLSGRLSSIADCVHKPFTRIKVSIQYKKLTGRN